MLKKISTICFAFLLFVSATQEIQALSANDGKLVRVGISNQNFKEYYFSNIQVSATDTFKLIDKKTNTLLGDFGAGEILKITIKSNLMEVKQDTTTIAKDVVGPIEVSSENGFVTIPNLKRVGKPAYYRGTFEITKAPSKNDLFNVINILDLQSYLQGVVPNEMPVRFGEEALKAQSILARNYVLKPREKNYHNFDVCDSVACQVYFGANTEKQEANEAISQTENIVATHNGELILALYSSTSGGYTENYENAFSTDFGNGKRMFPGLPNHCLKGVPDNPNTPELKTEEDVKNFYTTKPDTFDNASPYFRWTKEWTINELEDVLKKTLKTQSSTGFVKPRLENIDDFGRLKEIKVTKRGVSGKAMSVDIITDKNTFTVQKELQIRRVFQKNNIGLPSANVIFEITDETTNAPTPNTQKSNEKQVIAIGGGYGHGVGMSQWGAGEMARRGYSYDEIIQHYYQNSAITTYPVELSNQQNTFSQKFYVNKEKGKTFLVIDNKLQFTKLTVVINAQELLIEMSPSFFKPEKIDISKYVVDGENTVTYILPYSDANKKNIQLYIELKESKNGQ